MNEWAAALFLGFLAGACLMNAIAQPHLRKLERQLDRLRADDTAAFCGAVLPKFLKTQHRFGWEAGTSTSPRSRRNTGCTDFASRAPSLR